jgi:DNA polymerase-3 subunit epsilon
VTNLGLRLRIFLFFCLICLGALAMVLLGLWLGYHQLGDPAALSAFITTGAVAGFGLLAITTFVWRLFDDHVSKPIEQIAARFRIHAEAGISGPVDEQLAKYLGDLAPAASAIHTKLRQAAQATADKTRRLELERTQLLRILSDLPVAVIVVTQDHQIALYDGQAAELLEHEAPIRLNGSIFDYLDEAMIRTTLAEMKTEDILRRDITINGTADGIYSGHLRTFGLDTGYSLMLEPLYPDAERPLVYDFDLFEVNKSTGLSDTPLRHLAFTVFDSETTGLDPHTDAVVQLGAVRVVNGKVIETETFDALVNPVRPIPARSTAVHGISDAMVATAPTFEVVSRDFHAFARNSVLIAHNAPFDMAFLHRETAQAGYSYTNPVLDTVHLSAIIFGGSAEHTLDAICDRLDITIPEDLRHTALGDALATARAFVAMLPVLEARGFDTFGALLAEAQKHRRILPVQEQK